MAVPGPSPHRIDNSRLYDSFNRRKLILCEFTDSKDRRLSAGLLLDESGGFFGLLSRFGVVDQNLGSCAGEFEGDGPSDSGRGTGNNRSFPFKLCKVRCHFDVNRVRILSPAKPSGLSGVR